MPKGIYNHKPLSKEWKRKIGEANKGHIHSKETREKISKARIGIEYSEETKKKMGAWQKGRKLPEETRRKMAEARRGFKHSESTKLKMSNNKKGKPFSGKRYNHKGKKTSEETKLKISESNSGDKHYNWKGGITPENTKIRMSIDYRLWREAVFARDNWTCQKTGIKGGSLRAHHIKNFSDYPELRFAIDNGITFCKDSHIEFHKKYGRKNNNKEDILQFIQKTLEKASRKKEVK